jgi:hypothetical protein
MKLDRIFYLKMGAIKFGNPLLNGTVDLFILSYFLHTIVSL